MRIASRERRGLPPSLTPMVDVVMNLLFFFMLATSFGLWRTAGIHITHIGAPVPTGTSRHTHWVAIDAAEVLKYDGQFMNLDGIKAALRADPGSRVIVLPGSRLDLLQLLALSDALRSAGARVTVSDRGQ